ncbi:hypothetical protein BBJ28_00000341 [Nothophytophthora sp. Chile5]|nr:hypothetical protein BBJ28_00000341 [Nothophytophthora sp. Chile5]
MATTSTSSDAPSRRMQRDLAQALMSPQSGGVAGALPGFWWPRYRIECVHSTTVGMDATFMFLMQLIEELDDAIAEFLPPTPTTQPLPEGHELELGTLLSAASLTVRYVTERQAMVPLLQRYRDAFATVLHYPSWQRKSYLGLKAVALMGCTRVLESFGEQVPVADVLKQMRWLFPLFQTESTPATDSVQRVNALLRPACEYVAVALQTHPAARESIFSEVAAEAFDIILPQLLSLLIEEGVELQDTLVEESVQVELATTIAVLLEAKFPYTTPNPFALLPLPGFVEEMEADEASGSAGGTSSMFTPALESTAGKMETVDEEETKPAAATIALGQKEECGQVLCTLNDCALLSLPDFEFVNALLESIRDMCLCKQRLPTSTLEAAFQALSGVMSRLETALSASSEKHVTERRAMKSACSTIRHTLVEAFLAWLHHPGVANLVALHVEFLHNRKLLLHVVSFCMTHPHTVTQTLHEPLSRWPLYEEDVELVVVTLELLESLLRVDALRATVDVDVIYATILQLSENAGAERLDAISAACTQVLTSLGSQ